VEIKARTNDTEAQRDAAMLAWVKDTGHPSRSLFTRYGSIVGIEECEYLVKLYGKSLTPQEKKSFHVYKQVNDEDRLIKAPERDPKRLPFYRVMISSVFSYITTPASEFIQEAYARLEQSILERANRIETHLTQKIDSTTAEVSRSACEKVHEAAQKAAETFSERLTSSVLDPIRSLWESFTSSIRQFVQSMIAPLSLPEWISVALETILLAVFFTVCVRLYLGHTTWPVVYGSLAALLPLPVLVFCARLYTHFAPSEEPTKQGGAPTMGDFWQAFCGMFPGQSGLERGGWAEGIPRFRRLLEAIEWFGARLWKIGIWLYGKMTGHCLPTSKYEALVADIDNSFRPLHMKMKESSSWFTAFRQDYTLLPKIAACEAALNAARPFVLNPNNGVSPQFHRIFSLLAQEIATASAKARAFVRTAGERGCPVWLNLFGGKGKGKTYAANEIRRKVLEAMFKRTGRDEYAGHNHNDCFVVPQGDAFFDAYCGQMMLSIDDIFQGKGSENRQPLALWLMVFISTCPCPLLMATPEIKGTPCMAEFLVTTSNKDHFDDLGLEVPSALHDRIAFNVELVWVEPLPDGSQAVHHGPAPRGAKLPDGWSRQYLLRNGKLKVVGVGNKKLLTEDELVYVVVETAIFNQQFKNAEKEPYIPPDWAFEYVTARSHVSVGVPPPPKPDYDAHAATSPFRDVPPPEPVAAPAPKDDGAGVFPKCPSCLGTRRKDGHPCKCVKREPILIPSVGFLCGRCGKVNQLADKPCQCRVEQQTLTGPDAARAAFDRAPRAYCQEWDFHCGYPVHREFCPMHPSLLLYSTPAELKAFKRALDLKYPRTSRWHGQKARRSHKSVSFTKTAAGSM
jgi:hypothetical protein